MVYHEVRLNPKFIKCSYRLCKTRQPGIVVPIVNFKAIGANPLMMPDGHAIISGLRLCESCALSANVHAIVDNNRWADICKKIADAGGPPPDRDSLELILGSPKNQPLPKYLIEAFNRRQKLTQ